MSKIKYIAFFKKDAVFDSERIVGELLDICEQIDLGEDGAICKIQVVQGELVHCKDCKYWKKCIDEDYCSYWEEYCWIPAMEDDFCSRGEHK